MTRHGSLAYYLAAWVCGCFFMTICLVGTPHRPHFGSSMIRDILLLYFLALWLGAFTSLLFGFFLRRIALWLGFRTTWQWLVGGGILAPILIGALGSIFLLGGRAANALLAIYLYVLFAPGLVIQQGIGSVWRIALAGAATAFVLFRVQRAFALPIDRARET
jgi:hypothetical protein